MRKSYSLLTIGLLVFILYTPIAAQKVYSTADSSVTYLFNSEIDSVRELKITHFRHDSIERIDYSTSFNWDVDAGSWIKYSKWDYRYDSIGNLTGFNWYKWDSDSAKWIHRNILEKKYDQNAYLIYEKEFFWNKATSLWEGFTWEEFCYDNNGNQTMNLKYDYDYKNFIWKGTFKNEFGFDNNNRDTSLVKYNWNVSTESWQISLKQRFEYETEGMINSKITFQWNDTLEEWIRIHRVESSFDSSGNLESRIDYNLDSKEEWVETHKEEYDYDQYGNLLFKRTYAFGQAEWIEVSRLICEYDQWGNQILSEERFSYHGAENAELGFGIKSVYSYDHSGNLTYSARYSWSIPPYWKGVNKYEYVYNDSGWMIHQLHHKWSKELLDWEFYISEEYLYHASGIRTTSINWGVDRLGLDSVVISKEFFYPGDHYFTTYDSLCAGDDYEWQGQYINSEGFYKMDYQSVTGQDSTYTLNLKVNPNPDNFVITGDTEVIQGENSLYVAPIVNGVSYSWHVENGTILSEPPSDSLMVFWDNPGDATVISYATNINGCNSETSTLHIHIGPNGIDNMRSDQFTVYPIPVHDFLHISTNIKFSKVEILDMFGRCVMNSPIAIEIINISDLASGTYLLRIKDKGNRVISTRKILKE